MNRGEEGVHASPYMRTFHSLGVDRFVKIHDLGDGRAKVAEAKAKATSAAAFGVVAKQPECIFTPPGTPMRAMVCASGPSASRRSMSRVVPSPPA